MNNYELTLVMPGNFTEAKKKATLESVQKLIKVFEGKVEKLEEWGKIDLAYQIKKQSTGIFLHINLGLSPSLVKGLAEKIKFEDGIIRYLLIRKENPPLRKASAR